MQRVSPSGARADGRAGELAKKGRYGADHQVGTPKKCAAETNRLAPFIGWALQSEATAPTGRPGLSSRRLRIGSMRLRNPAEPSPVIAATLTAQNSGEPNCRRFYWRRSRTERLTL